MTTLLACTTNGDKQHLCGASLRNVDLNSKYHAHGIEYHAPDFSGMSVSLIQLYNYASNSIGWFLSEKVP